MLSRDKNVKDEKTACLYYSVKRRLLSWKICTAENKIKCYISALVSLLPLDFILFVVSFRHRVLVEFVFFRSFTLSIFLQRYYTSLTVAVQRLETRVRICSKH